MENNLKIVFYTPDCNTGIELNVILAKTETSFINEALLHFILFTSIKFVKVRRKTIPLIKLLWNNLFLFPHKSKVTHLKFHLTKK